MTKIIDIDSGKLLVASDIHGNWETYQAIKDRFNDLKKKGKADVLVLAGDLVHSYSEEDNSVKILDDLIDNSDSTVLSLLGNHELMHIYHMDVSKGEHESFAEPLEEQIEDNRERYLNFMKQMPYTIRTTNVTINHTGANPPMGGYGQQQYKHLIGPIGFQIMNELDHDQVLEQFIPLTRQLMEEELGHELASDYFDDFTSEVGEVFGQTDIGSYLWDVFFNMNEKQFEEETYLDMLGDFLQTMSLGGRSQRFLVSGHVETTDYDVIGGKQLRITSDHSGGGDSRVLSLVDASREYNNINQLVEDLDLLELKQ